MRCRRPGPRAGPYPRRIFRAGPEAGRGGPDCRARSARLGVPHSPEAVTGLERRARAPGAVPGRGPRLSCGRIRHYPSRARDRPWRLRSGPALGRPCSSTRRWLSRLVSADPSPPVPRGSLCRGSPFSAARCLWADRPQSRAVEGPGLGLVPKSVTTLAATGRLGSRGLSVCPGSARARSSRGRSRCASASVPGTHH